MKIGKVSESVLKRSILRQIRTKTEEVENGAGVGEDCAVFSLRNSRRFMSCQQEGVLRYSPAEEGEALESREEADRTATSISVLIQKCANNLAAGGAKIKALQIALLLPPALEESKLKEIMAEAEKKCALLKTQIVGGQTRVTEAVRQPVVMLTGFGIPFEGYAWKKAVPGMDVIITKWIGLEGTALLAGEFRQELSQRYPAYFIREAADLGRYLDLIPEAATAVKSGVCMMHDASEGGIFAALWELAEKAGVGLTIELKKIPLRQETVEVCEYCEANPYELMSGGCLILLHEDGEKLIAALAAEGIPAVIVGKTTDSRDRILMNDDEVRYLDRPKQDAIHRLKI